MVPSKRHFATFRVRGGRPSPLTTSAAAAFRSALIWSTNLPFEERQTVAISKNAKSAKICIWEYSESIVAFVCVVPAQIGVMPADSCVRKYHAVLMVLPDKALAKLAAEAVGLPPKEAGGGQSSSRVASTQHGTVPFRRLPSPSCSMGCGCGLWAERHMCSVTRLCSARRPARRLDSATRRGSAARRRRLRSTAPRGDSAQLGGSARLPASAARRLGGAAFAPSTPIAPSAPSAPSALSARSALRTLRAG